MYPKNVNTRQYSQPPIIIYRVLKPLNIIQQALGKGSLKQGREKVGTTCKMLTKNNHLSCG